VVLGLTLLAVHSSAGGQDLGLGPVTELEVLPPSTAADLRYFPGPSLRIGVGGTRSDLAAEVGVNFIKSHFAEFFAALDFENYSRTQETYTSALLGSTVGFPIANLFVPGVMLAAGGQAYSAVQNESDEASIRYDGVLHMGPEVRFLLGKTFYLSAQKDFLQYLDQEGSIPRATRQLVRFTMVF
jgi:hypothetical protein